jgi:hypothetical protein
MQNIFTNKELTFSFVLFVSKTEEGYSKLLNTLPLLKKIGCTYG